MSFNQTFIFLKYKKFPRKLLFRVFFPRFFLIPTFKTKCLFLEFERSYNCRRTIYLTLTRLKAIFSNST